MSQATTMAIKRLNMRDKLEEFLRMHEREWTPDLGPYEYEYDAEVAQVFEDLVYKQKRRTYYMKKRMQEREESKEKKERGP